jgi:hypothetical protein
LRASVGPTAATFAWTSDGLVETSQAAEVIEQLLAGRPADSVPLMVEDR